jgi:hypothetical protein
VDGESAEEFDDVGGEVVEVVGGVGHRRGVGEGGGDGRGCKGGEWRVERRLRGWGDHEWRAGHEWAGANGVGGRVVKGGFWGGGKKLA